MNTNVAYEFNKVISRNERNYNKHVRCKRNFVVGQDVWFMKDPTSNKWIKGKIINNNFRSYKIIDSENECTYTRTSYHVRPQ